MNSGMSWGVALIVVWALVIGITLQPMVSRGCRLIADAWRKLRHGY